MELRPPVRTLRTHPPVHARWVTATHALSGLYLKARLLEHIIPLTWNFQQYLSVCREFIEVTDGGHF